jgi:hypothetical protein
MDFNSAGCSVTVTREEGSQLEEAARVRASATALEIAAWRSSNVISILNDMGTSVASQRGVDGDRRAQGVQEGDDLLDLPGREG